MSCDSGQFAFQLRARNTSNGWFSERLIGNADHPKDDMVNGVVSELRDASWFEVQAAEKPVHRE